MGRFLARWGARTRDQKAARSADPLRLTGAARARHGSMLRIAWGIAWGIARESCADRAAEARREARSGPGEALFRVACERARGGGVMSGQRELGVFVVRVAQG